VVFPVAVSLAIPLADGYSVVSLSCYATVNDNSARITLTFLLQCSLILLAFKTRSHCSQIFLLRRHLFYFTYGQC